MYSANPEPYQLPDYNIDKCTVVKAVYYDKEGKKFKVLDAHKKRHYNLVANGTKKRYLDVVHNTLGKILCIISKSRDCAKNHRNAQICTSDLCILFFRCVYKNIML